MEVKYLNKTISGEINEKEIYTWFSLISSTLVIGSQERKGRKESCSLPQKFG